MTWLPPAVLAAMSGSVLLALVHAYLWATQGRERHLRLWAAAWALSAVRYLATLWGALSGPPPPSLAQLISYEATLASTWFLMVGTQAFVGQPVHPLWRVLAALEAVRIAATIALGGSFLSLTLPLFVLLGLTMFWMGSRFLRAGGAGIGPRLVGWVCLAWGLHRLDYPFLRPVEWFAPWGFLLATELELLAALGMLLLHVEHASRRLKESEGRYQRLVEGVPAGILLVLDEQVLVANAAAAQLLGEAGPAALEGRRLSELARETNPGHEVARALLRVLTQGREGPSCSEERLLLPEGDPLELEVTVLPAEAGQGPRALQLVLRDVTERNRLEARLRQAARMEAMGRLAGGVAHDFNNLLTAIQGYASLILLRTPEGDPRRPSCEELLHAGERAAELTRQLLTFSRQRPISRRGCDLNQVVGGARPLLLQLLGPSVRLELETCGAALPLHADPAQLELVLVNLAVNARDAMPAGGTLHVATSSLAREDLPPEWPGERDEGGVVLEVRDDGQGMDPATQAHLFEPFFTTKSGGTGLGLVTVQRVVTQAEGVVQVESRPGEGTTFRVILPRSPQLPGQLPARDEADLPAGQGAVLLVDDEPAIRETAALALEEAGYQVLKAGDAAEARRQAAGAARLDLLVTDLLMPGEGGLELATALREARPGLRVLFVTGYVPDHLELHDPVLVKPFTAWDLARRTRELLGR